MGLLYERQGRERPSQTPPIALNEAMRADDERVPPLPREMGPYSTLMASRRPASQRGDLTQAQLDHAAECDKAADAEQLLEEFQEARQKPLDYRHGADHQPFNWTWRVHLQSCLARS
jgi:hypothetical protein